MTTTLLGSSVVTPTFASIEQAALTLKGRVYQTPTIQALWLSDLIEGQVFLKLENLQLTGSIKARGACLALTEMADKTQGVATFSTGNHGKSIAYYAQKMGIPCTIVMPETTPISTVEAIHHCGASVILHGSTVTETHEFNRQLMKGNKHHFIHPFENPDIIRGQGTVALEFLEEIPDIDIMLVPIGGGALATGMGIVLKHLNPQMQIIGVQPAMCPTIAEILFPNSLSCTERKESSLAESLCIPTPFNLESLKFLLDDMMIVNEEMIGKAMQLLAHDNKIIVEGAAATSVAALMQYPDAFKQKKVGIIICGGNVPPPLLSQVIAGPVMQKSRLVKMKIKIKIGDNNSITQLTQIISKIGGHIFDMSHERLDTSMTHVTVVVETHDMNHTHTICQALNDAGFRTTLIDS